jgi:hypothetical protein
MSYKFLVVALSLGLAAESTACASGGRMKSTMSFVGANAGGSAPPVGPSSASADPASRMAIPEQLVIEGNLRVEVDKVADIVDALRTQVESAGGRVVVETVNGAEESWTAEVKIRVPPANLESTLKWIATRGNIIEKRMTANDVSKELFDQELEIANQQAALDRLGKLLEQGGLAMADVLSIEKEMTRIRGRIDELKGATRFTKDRVAYATVDIYFSRKYGTVNVASAKAYPGARAVMMTLLAPGNLQRTRFGGGFVVHPTLRTWSFEVDVFGSTANEAADARSRAVIATMGGAFYSDFLGAGQRQFLNPYIGYRAGYGYLDSSRFVAQFEAGVELVKTKHVVVDANVRATGLIGSNTDLGLVSAVGAVVAF